MLFKTTQEVLEVAKVNGSLNFASLTGSIKAAEKRHIIPAIGDALYSRIESKYAANTLTDKEAKLLARLQDALGNFAVAIHIPRSEVQVGDGGITRVESDSHKSAYKNQVDRLIAEYETAGYEAEERLLAWLEDNAADFPEWQTSSERKLLHQLLIKGGLELRKYYSQLEQPCRTYRSSLTYMRTVETLMAAKIIGTEYKNLKDRQTSGNLSENDSVLIGHLKSAVAHLTIWKALPALQLRIDRTGVTVMGPSVDNTRNDDSKRISADMKQIDMLSESLYADGMAFLEEATRFLDDNCSEEIYPDWYAAKQAASTAETDNTDINSQLNGSYYF